MKTPQKLTIYEPIDCDIDKLFNVDLREAAEYLLSVYKKYPNAALDEHWTGYEDMEIRFLVEREETDEEFFHRLRLEAEQKRIQALVDEVNKKHQEKEKQFKQMANELGYDLTSFRRY